MKNKLRFTLSALIWALLLMAAYVASTHAQTHATASQPAAATAIRALNGEELDRAAPVTLNSDALFTCQFMLEDHAMLHTYHHLAHIRAALNP